MPVYIVVFISPQFNKLIKEITEDEAVRVANHLACIFLEDNRNLSEKSTWAEWKIIDEHVRKEFQIKKIKLFLPSGEIIHSSDPKDIGEINKHDYFTEFVAKGKTFTKVVKKHELSLEGKEMAADVVETYVPILRGGEFVGAFEIYFDITKSKGRLERLLTHVYVILGLISGILLSLIVINAVKARRYEEELRRCSTTDDLTGLLNRRGFMTLAEKQISLSSRIEDELFLLYADVDNMKWINDNLGHKIGDQALADTANAMRETFRKSDILCRLGGDEFAVLLRCDPKEECEKTIIKRFEENLQKAARQFGNVYDLQISTGIVKYSCKEPCSVEDLLAKADKLMYENKALKQS